MTDQFWLTLPTTIAAIGALWVGLRNSRKVDANTKTTDETAAKADVIIGKSDEIHSLTNGHLSKVTEELKAANARADVQSDKISALEKMVSQLLVTKALIGRRQK